MAWGRPKKIATVVKAEPEAEMPPIEPAKPEKFYQIIDIEMLESGLLRTITVSNVNMGEVGKVIKVEE